MGTTTDGARPEGDDEIFERLRPELFGLAYRMLGSAVDAADIVADAYLRWRGSTREDVCDPRAYLATVVARLSIDSLTSARARREELAALDQALARARDDSVVSKSEEPTK